MPRVPVLRLTLTINLLLWNQVLCFRCFSDDLVGEAPQINSETIPLYVVRLSACKTIQFRHCEEGFNSTTQSNINARPYLSSSTKGEISYLWRVPTNESTSLRLMVLHLIRIFSLRAFSHIVSKIFRIFEKAGSQICTFVSGNTP